MDWMVVGSAFGKSNVAGTSCEHEGFSMVNGMAGKFNWIITFPGSIGSLFSFRQVLILNMVTAADTSTIGFA